MAIPKAYEGKEPYIFISYAHKDSDRVLPIIQGLQDRGFRVWYDAGIEAGTEWPEYIAEHLDGCTCFLAFLSQSALESPNCRREINFAIDLRKDPLAVYLEEVQLTLGMRMQLGTLQAMFSYRHKTMESFLETLAGSVMLKPCQGAAPTPVFKPAPVSAPPAPKTSTAAELYRQGMLLYNKSRYADAIPLLLQAGNQGNADAQYQLGWCYYCGNGVPQNFATAAKWYQKAAEQGRVKAQYNLAELYEKSRGYKFPGKEYPPYSREEMIKWYQAAAAQGHEDAKKKLQWLV